MKYILIVLMALIIFSSTVFADSRLIGDWGINGEALYHFRADGTGDAEGGRFRWEAANGVLLLTADGESERIAYKVQGNTLVVMAGATPLTLVRIGKTLSGPANEQNNSMDNPTQRSEAGTDQLSKLLLSSAWCSFSYNKTTGATKTQRYQFFRDGTWSDRARTEGYSSGYGGSMASQHDGGGSGRWLVKNGQLFLAGAAGGNLQPVQLQVTTNSSGYPIITTGGVEYSQCN